MQVEIKAPYLLFLGDEPEQSHAKTAIGIAHWRPDSCVAQLRLPGSCVDLGFPEMTPAEAANAGARSMIWGVAGVGGIIPEHWTAEMTQLPSTQNFLKKSLLKKYSSTKIARHT